MGTFGPFHWLLLGVVVLLLFGGRGRVSDFMGDFAKGIKNFREGLKDDDEAERAKKARSISADPAERADAAKEQPKEPAAH